MCKIFCTFAAFFRERVDAALGGARKEQKESIYPKIDALALPLGLEPRTP